MDGLSHALLGAAAARATAGAQDALPLRHRVLLGAAAGVFPDVDFVLFPLDPLRFLADWHQAATHSLMLLPAWAALLAAAYAAWSRTRERFAAAWAVAALGIGSHVVGDLITVYGAALFVPLSDTRYALGTTFVVDPVFTLALAAGLVWSLRRGTRIGAVAGLAAVALLVALHAMLREEAREAGRASARALGLPNEALVALPQPYSPFHWKLIVRDGERHHVAHLKLLDHPTPVPDLPGLRTLHRSAAAYVPAGALAWHARPLFGARDRASVEGLWNDERLAPFRRFAAYPALSEIDPAARCVWFTDLRYDVPALPDTFRYGFCREADAWSLYRLRYLGTARQRLD